MTTLHGPYELSVDSLERSLPRGGGGVFALGYIDSAGRFRVERVGRDEADLKGRLRNLIGSGNLFKYAAVDAREAFELECEIFHRLRPPSNITHPDRPRGTDWKCRQCLQLHF